MEPTALQLADRYQRRVQRLQNVCIAGQKASDAGHIRQTDLDYLYESTFLSVFSGFEEYLENLFYSVLLGASGISGVNSRVVFANRRIAENILMSESTRSFVVWLPIDNTMNRADTFLTGGRPFSRLKRRTTDIRMLKEASIVRNAIAHESGSASRNFRALLPPSMPSRLRTPSRYLQLQSQGQSNYDSYCADLRRVARALAEVT